MEQVTMYTTPWCGHCRRLKRHMDTAGISYREVDVDEDHSYDERIIAATGGSRTVPTLQVGDRLLVNPTIHELDEALGKI